MSASGSTHSQHGDSPRSECSETKSSKSSRKPPSGLEVSRIKAIDKELDTHSPTTSSSKPAQTHSKSISSSSGSVSSSSKSVSSTSKSVSSSSRSTSPTSKSSSSSSRAASTSSKATSSHSRETSLFQKTASLAPSQIKKKTIKHGSFKFTCIEEEGGKKDLYVYKPTKVSKKKDKKEDAGRSSFLSLFSRRGKKDVGKENTDPEKEENGGRKGDKRKPLREEKE